MHGATIKIACMYSALTLEKAISLHKKTQFSKSLQTSSHCLLWETLRNINALCQKKKLLFTVTPGAAFDRRYFRESTNQAVLSLIDSECSLLDSLLIPVVRNTNKAKFIINCWMNFIIFCTRTTLHLPSHLRVSNKFSTLQK